MITNEAVCTLQTITYYWCCTSYVYLQHGWQLCELVSCEENYYYFVSNQLDAQFFFL